VCRHIIDYTAVSYIFPPEMLAYNTSIFILRNIFKITRNVLKLQLLVL
jgi:hypothetical protein